MYILIDLCTRVYFKVEIMKLNVLYKMSCGELLVYGQGRIGIIGCYLIDQRLVDEYIVIFLNILIIF